MASPDEFEMAALPPMDDPAEALLQVTRERSLANRHKFHFLADGEDAIVAIGKRSASGEHALQGTGFFVAPGLVATACHVFRGDDVEEGDVFQVWQQRRGILGTRTIAEVVDGDPVDVAICRVTPVGGTDDSADWENHPIAAVVTGGDPESDEVLGSVTAAHTLVGSVVDLGNGIVGQRMQWRTAWELGGMVAVHPDGFGRLVGHAFQTTIFVDGRGSGGPLIDSAGLVAGLMNTDWSPTDEMPISFGLSIDHVLDLEIGDRSVMEHIKSAERRPAPIPYFEPEGGSRVGE